jgi:DNA-binding phage protein
MMALARAQKKNPLGPFLVTALCLVMFIKHLGVDPEKLFTIKAIRREIKARGISQLAKKIGVTRQELQRIAKGEREPSERILQLIGVKRVVFYVNAGDAMDFEEQSSTNSKN